MGHTEKLANIPSPEWWKHLKPYNKRKFYKKVRKAFKRLIKEND